jgi:phosphatidylethanolamine-binding protein (PEBP) family uncharacterized protein
MHPVEVLLVPLGKAFRNRRADPDASLANAPELASSTRLSLTSPSFVDGQEIPARFCGPFIGYNVSPALEWGTLPANTVSVILLFEDLDSPGAAPGIHTIAQCAPTEGLAEGALNDDPSRFTFLPRRGKPGGYVGPRPMPGHGPHRYRFHVYALDTAVDFTSVSDVARLPAAMKGHTLASGTLMGIRTS